MRRIFPEFKSSFPSSATDFLAFCDRRVERQRLIILVEEKKSENRHRCYICLEGEEGGKLMRGCACRGDSAGFVHLECLTELAKSKEDSDDKNAIWAAWTRCGNCKQIFTGALDLEMERRFWRHHRSRQNDGVLRYNSTKCLAVSLGFKGEVDAANQLFNEASNCVGNHTEPLVELKLLRASILIKNDKKLDGLELLQAVLPEAKAYTAHPSIYGETLQQITDVLLSLDRNQEAHEAATELVPLCKAKFGLEYPLTLNAMTLYAVACAKLGRLEEAKANFEAAITTQTRVLGHNHAQTQETRQFMRNYGFAVPSG